MLNLLAIITGVTSQDLSQVYTIPAGQTAESLAEQLGLSFLQWAEFDQAADFPGTENWPTAFELVIGVGDSKTVVFNLSTAKVSASNRVKSQTATEQQSALAGYTPEAIAGQAALAVGSRIPEIQAAIVATNTLSTTLQTSLAAIAAATTINEVNNIANPPTGTLFTGRGTGSGPEDLNPSYFSTFNSASASPADMELYIPGTSITIPYYSGLPFPYTFEYLGNCFNPGDYLMQVRIAATSQIVAEFEVPLNSSGEDVAF